MTMRAMRHVMAGVAVAAGLLLGAGTAEATVQTLSFGPLRPTTSNGRAQTLIFDQFDLAGFHLIEVDFAILNPFYGNGSSASITNGKEGDTFQFGGGTSLSVTGPGARTIWSATSRTIASCNVPSGSTGCSDTSGVGLLSIVSDLIVSDPGELLAYAGAGMFGVAIAAGRVQLIRTPCPSGATCNGGADVEFGGDLQVTFIAEADVPEPASLALLGAGIAGLGWVRRRRRWGRRTGLHR